MAFHCPRLPSKALHSRDSLQLEYTDCLLDKNRLRKRIAELQVNLEQLQRELEREQDRSREQMRQSSSCLNCVSWVGSCRVERLAQFFSPRSPSSPRLRLCLPPVSPVPPVPVQRGPVLRPLLFPWPRAQTSGGQQPFAAAEGQAWLLQ